MFTLRLMDFLAVICTTLFIYSAYNLSILMLGVKLAYRRLGTSDQERGHPASFPFISIILPVKNEEPVVRRALDALLNLEYPVKGFEVIVVEDHSTDQTPAICSEYAARYPDTIRYLHREASSGKPAALNAGLTQARGEIIGIFDADNVPESTVLTRVAKRFEEEDLVAVQGQLRSMNPDETMLAHLIHYERVMQLHLQALGKDRLGLFVPFAGTNLFIRRRVLQHVGGWQDTALSEDLELSAKLIQANHEVTYAPEVSAWQENPATYRRLMTQRTRWYRGCMDVAMQYGSLLKQPNTLHLDAELYFFGPFIMMLAFVTGLLYSILTFMPPSMNSYAGLIAQSSCMLAGILITVWGLVLATISRPRTLANLKWLPLVYLYCAFQGVVATLSFALLVLRRPRTWTRTEKTGVITIEPETTHS